MARPICPRPEFFAEINVGLEREYGECLGVREMDDLKDETMLGWHFATLRDTTHEKIDPAGFARPIVDFNSRAAAGLRLVEFQVWRRRQLELAKRRQ